MPTNKPEVVLPELPKPAFVTEDDDLFTKVQVIAYGQACIDTLTRPADNIIDGPDVFDGCDHEGFVGGCERFGHTPETCPYKPAEAVAWIAEKTGRSSFTGKVRTDRAAFLTYPADAEADGYRVTPLYLTPPAAIDIEKLRELAVTWKNRADESSERATLVSSGKAVVFTNCADELLALIGDGGEKGNG